MLTPWASQIILCGCIGALGGFIVGAITYLMGIYFVYIPPPL